MSKTSRELIEFCKGKLGTPYVFGMKGEILTEALLQQLAAENPKVYTPQYITKARSFMGKHCTDCSGLITWCTGILRGSANYKETAREVRPIRTLDESMTGWALWKPGHIGVYIGNGKCIEAKGINYGTVETRAQDTPWVSVLKLKDIDYSAQVCESAVPFKGIQLIKGKPYYFNRDGQMAKFGTRFMVQVDKNGVLHFPEEESVETPVMAGGILEENGTGRELKNTSPDKTEGKTPALAAYEGSEYTGGTVLPPDMKAGTTSEADSKVGHALTKETSLMPW